MAAVVCPRGCSGRVRSVLRGIGPSAGKRQDQLFLPCVSSKGSNPTIHTWRKVNAKHLEASRCVQGVESKQHIEGWLAWAHRGAGGVCVRPSGGWSWHPVPRGALARSEGGFKQDHEK